MNQSQIMAAGTVHPWVVPPASGSLEKLTETLGSDFILQTIGSEGFRKGLMTALIVTEASGCEAQFVVNKVCFRDQVVYPDYIEVGSPITMDRDEALKYRDQRFEKETGKKVRDIKWNNESDPLLAEYMAFMIENFLWDEEYPDVENPYKDALYYSFLGFHTHPLGDPTPSLWFKQSDPHEKVKFRGDLSHLNSSKRLYAGTFRPNPVMVIAGIENTKKKHIQTEFPVVLLQERFDRPLEDDEIVKGNQHINEISKRNAGIDIYAEGSVVTEIPYYNIAFGRFSHQSGLSLADPSKIGNFSHSTNLMVNPRAVENYFRSCDLA